MPNYILHIEGQSLNNFYGWVGGGERFFKVGVGGARHFLRKEEEGRGIFEARNDYPGGRFFRFNCLVPYVAKNVI